jgi:hypothetical protein
MSDSLDTKIVRENVDSSHEYIKVGVNKDVS